MSRTIRTNKYGETKTDKYKRNFNGCGCAYCEFINKDFRNYHREKFKDLEIRDNINYIDDRYDELEDSIINEDYELDSISDNNMKEYIEKKNEKI